MHNRDSRRAVALVGLANFAYCFVEFAMARRIGSVLLFADSVDFLEDAAVNLLIFVALAWTARRRAGQCGCRGGSCCDSCLALGLA
jgi:Co/Zn/Cd efflux system component